MKETSVVRALRMAAPATLVIAAAGWFGPAALLAPASAAEEECEAEAPFTNCARFTAEGADQTFVVPADVTSIDVRMWGAGGGGDTEEFANPRGLSGGGGGFTTGTVEVTPGQELTVTSGQGGVPASTEQTYGGGGAGGGGFFPGSSGGGMSALWDGAFGANPLLIAGGGGGISVGTPIQQDGIGGGGGGGETGSWDFSPETSGGPGTQTEGGAPPASAVGCSVAPTAGAELQGGDGGTPAGEPDGTEEGGGGGGGGFFGGGGGRCQDDSADPQNGAGGGGSGFIDGEGVTDATTTEDPTQSNGDLVPIGEPAPPDGTDDPFYSEGVGVGAFVGNGGDGEVVIQWVTPPEASIVKSIDNDAPAAGDTVTYSVVVTNTGEVDFPGLSFTDDLSGVIDDATYNNDAESDIGTVSYAEPTLTWEGDLAVGEAATITYTATVTDDGDGTLENAVVAEVEGTNCSAEPAGDGDPGTCAATATVQDEPAEPAPSPPSTPGPLPLPDTGPTSSVATGVAGAGALLLLGAAAMLDARRRSSIRRAEQG